MQTTPGHATSYRGTSNGAHGRVMVAEYALMTPAERIALTIAVLNHGLDLIHRCLRSWRKASGKNTGPRRA